jgi:HD superfamily phosphohydrolase
LPSLGPLCRDLVAQIRGAAPKLSSQLDTLAGQWLSPLGARLANDDLPTDQKILNDPIWGSIALRPAETLLLDTPLLQRLRGVRQLGMAHLVYPGAGYGRLEHVCGVVEAASRILTALHLSAVERGAGDAVRPPSPNDVVAIRIAALLHDIGHGPFSHATEDMIAAHYNEEIEAATAVLFGHFAGVIKIAPSEVLTALIMLSDPLLSAITHARFPVPEKEILPLAMVGSVIGSAQYFSAPYLAGVLSGPIDADKLDYMARDSHHAGLTLGLETTRLLSQLQIVTVTTTNAPNEDLRTRAESCPDKRYHDLGISRAGLGAYEQMVVGRAILDDRVYYHHKVRAAEAMVRRLVELAERDHGRLLDIAQLLTGVTDETFLCLLGNIVTMPGFPSVSEETRGLALSLTRRDLFYRAHAFAARCLAGLDALDEPEKSDTRLIVGNEILRLASNFDLARSIEGKITERAIEIAKALAGKYGPAVDLRVSQVIVDLPRPDRVSTRGPDILLRAGSSDVDLPNLYFDPDKWSQAYQSQKHCGYVFCPREHIPSVNLAAKIVFAESLGIVMGPAADRLAKTSRLHEGNVFARLLEAGLISADAFARLARNETRLAFLQQGDFILPEPWTTSGYEIRGDLERQFQKARTKGFTASQHRALIDLVDALSSFYDMTLRGGSLKTVKVGQENVLQEKLRDHIRSRDYLVDEASKLGGGATDLVFERLLVIENKIYGETDNPLDVALDYGWQARRYAIPLSQEVFAVVVGYKPKTEAGMKHGPRSIRIRRQSDGTVEIRLAVPVDYPDPSAVKAA